MDLLTILPMAIVMISGPQIISAVFLATSTDWARNSRHSFRRCAHDHALCHDLVRRDEAREERIQFRQGDRQSRPRHRGARAPSRSSPCTCSSTESDQNLRSGWGNSRTATPRFSFILGFLLLGFFPTDIATLAAVAAGLTHQGDPLWYAIPFILLTLLFLALPVLLVALLGKRAHVFLPKVRDWMNTNSWIVSEIVIVFFTVITIHSLTS